MNEIKVCFICTTPYQLITSVNLVLQYRLNADLYICTNFRNAKEIADRIRVQKIFIHVIIVDTSIIEKYKKYKNKLLVHLCIAHNYLRIDRIVKSFLLPDTLYKKIYVSSKANIGRLVGLFFLKQKIEVETIYFDDGESSYDNKSFMVPSKADALLRNILFGRKKIEVTKLLLYSPFLYKQLNPKNKFSVEGLPALKKDKLTRNILNSIFNLQVNDIIKEKVIVFDIIKSENLILGEEKKLKKVYNLFFQELGSSNIIIKRHPRDKTKSTGKYNCYKNSSIPFEVLLLNMDINEKVLVTVNSTAVVAPKLLFGMEPMVIYLGNLIQTKLSKIADTKGFYNACKKLYANSDRFFIPNSFEELEDYIMKNKSYFNS